MHHKRKKGNIINHKYLSNAVLGSALLISKFNIAIPITDDIPFGGLSLAAVVGILLNYILSKIK